MLADERQMARQALMTGHAAAWAFGGDQDDRRRWHLAQEYAAGWHDWPRLPDGHGDPH